MLVDELRDRGDLKNWRLEDAFATVPRHLFLPDVTLSEAYSDKSIAVCYDTTGESTCSATMPSMIAYLLNQLQLEDGHNVLEIGTGTAYSAALIRNIIGPEGRVTTLEIERPVVQLAQDNLLRAGVTGVNVVHVDGAEGYAPRAAYDRIVSTVGIWDIPPAWLRQLKPGGRIVAPVALDGLQVTGAFTVQPDGSLLCEEVMPSAFVYIRGAMTPPVMRKRIGSTALTLIADDVSMIDSVAMHVLLSSDGELSRLDATLDSADYWYGFLPYLMMCEPEKSVFALYDVVDDQKAYGLHGEGFALFTPASACFVPYYGLGNVHNFAGSDAYMLVEDYLTSWRAIGRPSIDQLRLRFIPKTTPKTLDKPEITIGKLFERRDHHLHIWFEDATTE